MTKNENQNHKTGRDERDGLTGVRRSWAGTIAHCLQACGTEKQGLWFTHKAIKKRLQDQGYIDAPEVLTQFLYSLVKSGHVERAEKPYKGEFRPRQEFIYRRTAKTWQDKTGQGMRGKPDEIAKAFQRRMDHRRLPKWFRDMME